MKTIVTQDRAVFKKSTPGAHQYVAADGSSLRGIYIPKEIMPDAPASILITIEVEE